MKKTCLVSLLIFVAISAFYWAGYKDGSRNAEAKFSKMNATANINVPIYGDANINSSTVGWVVAGDTVSVELTQCDFYQIKYVQSNGSVLSGWVENRYIVMNALGGDE